VDGEEIEQLHEREPDDPERREEEQLAAADAKAPALRQEEREAEGDGGPGRPELGQPRRGEPGVEDALRDRAVDPPHGRRS
jgi:hypothetical protein